MSPARCAPGYRTGRHGFGRRSRAPACRAAWWIALVQAGQIS
ncbi:hypothetical protein I553_6170 [Mycobacterium xenopi 4042]|uniref:Uncharacterized protein n=1 Tax=Mycobacterium xenopi 4042 TaxID=1299334 RepID=X8BGZ8_MYCXE|nr:hypothetical protein I553_6170 [Mycobacterium xenopi 4042]